VTSTLEVIFLMRCTIYRLYFASSAANKTDRQTDKTHKVQLDTQ